MLSTGEGVMCNEGERSSVFGLVTYSLSSGSHTLCFLSPSRYEVLAEVNMLNHEIDLSTVMC